MVSDEVGEYHGRAEHDPRGEGGEGGVSACAVCDGVIERREGGGGGGGGGVVQSDGPRPPRRQHRGGAPGLVSSET